MNRKQGTGYGLLIAAGCFLWNPVVQAIDCLPDFIGYLLLLGGIARLADRNASLQDAEKRFRTALWISFGELAMQLFLLLYLRRASVAEDLYHQIQPSWILLFSSVVFAAECVVLIPAYRSLFRGLGELAERRNARHLSRDRHGRSPYERAARFAIPFIVGKNLLALLPELTSLTTYEYHYGTSETVLFDWYSYADLFRFILLIPALILTAIWLIRWIVALTGARRDEPFQDQLREEDRQERLHGDRSLFARRIRIAFPLFLCAIAFSASWIFFGSPSEEGQIQTFYGMEILPDFVAVLLLSAGAWMLREADATRRWKIAVAIPAFAAGLAEWILCTRYYQRYTLADASRIATAYDRMMALQIVGILSAVLTCACMWLMLQKIKRLILSRLCRDDSNRARVWSAYRVRMTAAKIVAVALAASRAATLILRARFSWLWWIPILMSAGLILITSSVFSDFAEEFAAERSGKNDESND